jgi:threonine dehydratase
MAKDPSTCTDQEIAAYVAEMAARLKKICEAKGWWSIAASLAMVLDEASRLAEGISEPPERH